MIDTLQTDARTKSSRPSSGIKKKRDRREEREPGAKGGELLGRPVTSAGVYLADLQVSIEDGRRLLGGPVEFQKFLLLFFFF